MCSIISLAISRPMLSLCIINLKTEEKHGLFNVRKFVEKPAADKAPSDLAIIGRYLLTPEIFDILDSQRPGAGGEMMQSIR